MTKSTNVAALMVAGWLALGCSGETAGDKTGDAGNGGSGSGGSAGGTSRVPERHRAVAEPCDRVRPTSDVPRTDAGSAGVCQAQVDCTEGENGRCTPWRNGSRFGWMCTYDQCFQDSDCAAADGGSARAVCLCGGPIGPMVGDNNVCLSVGNCRTDADCGSGHCSPSFGSCGNYTGVVAYYCHVPEDECIDDADCSTLDGSFGLPPYCAYAPAVGHWKCSSSHCVG